VRRDGSFQLEREHWIGIDFNFCIQHANRHGNVCRDDKKNFSTPCFQISGGAAVAKKNPVVHENQHKGSENLDVPEKVHCSHYSCNADVFETEYFKTHRGLQFLVFG